MDKKANTILISLTLAITALVLLFNMVGIRRAKLSNQNLQDRISQLNNRIYSLESEIRSITSNLQHELAKQASILSSYDIKLGELNVSELMVEAIIEVVPKETADDTVVEVTIGETMAVAEKTNNKYVAKAYVDALKTHEIVVSVKSNGVSRIEKLDRTVSAKHKFTEKAKASMNGPVVYKNSKLTLQENTLTIVYSTFENSEVEKARIFATIDDKEVWEKDITDDLRNAKGSLTYTLSKTFDVNSGSELYMHADIKETNGITYRIYLQGFKPYREGIINLEQSFAFAIIDKDGRIIDIH